MLLAVVVVVLGGESLGSVISCSKNGRLGRHVTGPYQPPKLREIEPRCVPPGMGTIYPRQRAYVHPAALDQFCSGHLCRDLCHQHQGLDRKAGAKVLGNYKSLGGLTGKIYSKPFFNQYFWFAIAILLVVIHTTISDISDTLIVGDRSLETLYIYFKF